MMRFAFLCVAIAASAAMAFADALQVLPAVRSEKMTDARLPAEGYRIRIDAKGKATVEAADAAGEFYARQTLRQLSEGMRNVEIEDWPAFGWRGLLLDESRHFFGKDVVKRLLDRMAEFKLNVLHWHLMDSTGNRFPLLSRSKMNVTGATRPAPDYSRWMHDEEFGSYGPFGYTADEIAEIRAYAKVRHVRIVPEVEIPGHSREVIAAYPELFCGSRDDFAQACAFCNDKKSGRFDCTAVCLGNPETIRFFEDVLDDVCELFPESDVIHIGGDECPRTNWERCTKCRTKVRELGLADAGGLQNWCTRHFVDYLGKKGRRALGWDEILEGGLAEGAYVMSWRGAEGGKAAAKAGHCAVMCPHEFCYLDYPQGLGASDGHHYPNWPGTPQLTLQKAYSFDPCAGISEAERKYVLGGQANNWTEFTVTERDLEWKLWPRALATAEVLWTGPGRRTFTDFSGRVRSVAERLRSEGVNVAPF